jgi:hypothetical protein
MAMHSSVLLLLLLLLLLLYTVSDCYRICKSPSACWAACRLMRWWHHILQTRAFFAASVCCLCRRNRNNPCFQHAA